KSAKLTIIMMRTPSPHARGPTQDPGLLAWPSAGSGDTHDTKKTGSDIGTKPKASSVGATSPADEGGSDEPDQVVCSQRRRFDPGLRRRMGRLRHASPCCRPGDGSDRSLQSDDERNATAHRRLRGLFLRVQLSDLPAECEPRSARSGAFCLGPWPMT